MYGLTASVSVALLSLATRPATFTVLGVLTAALAAVALRAAGRCARRWPPAPRRWRPRAWSAPRRRPPGCRRTRRRCSSSPSRRPPRPSAPGWGVIRWPCRWRRCRAWRP
ncbi:hypothetical protein ACFQ60_12715 [Streptomyces zhihengii]